MARRSRTAEAAGGRSNSSLVKPASLFMFGLLFVCENEKEVKVKDISPPSPGARLSKKGSETVKDRFRHSRPCVTPLKGQHHLTISLQEWIMKDTGEMVYPPD